MVDLTRRKAIGGVGGIILLGACAAAVDPDEEDTEAAADDTTDDGNGDDAGNGDDDGNGDDEPADEEENGEDDDGEEDAEPEVDEPADQEFSGSGATVEDVTVDGGLVVLEADHSGESNFQVSFVGGEFDEIFINEIGAYDGAAAELVDAGDYQMDVEADGDWSITVRQPRDTSGDGLPQSISGDGPDVFGPFEFSGNHTAEGSHSGEGNFQMQVYPVEGEFGEVVFNEIGEYSGETTFSFDGVGYAEVNADGDWSIDME